jgi:phosphoglycerate kinase
MAKLSVSDIEVGGRKIFVRVDFNVPLQDGEVSDDTRIRASLPTIQYLMGKGARTILASHLGRPKKGPDPTLSLQPVARRLEELLGVEVAFARDCVGADVSEAVARLAPGGVLLLENLRFRPEEEKNDAEFARNLAAPAQAYVNDAFGSAHRAHASTEGVTHYLSPCAAGFLMEKELAYLGRALESPVRPFVAVLGGSKISGKIDVIEHLLPKVDALLIGGAMMFTFLRAKGIGTGGSLVEGDRIPMAARVLADAEARHLPLRLPVDCRVASSVDGSDPGTIVGVEAIPPEKIGVDIGPATIEAYSRYLAGARTVLWNGPMGIFEVQAYAGGTLAVAKTLAAVTAGGATTIVGGGDSAAAIAQAGLEGSVSHVSTGGGASLEFLEGKVLPGVAALTERSA